MLYALKTEIILGLIAFIASSYLGIAVYLRNPKSATNKLFALLALIINFYIVVNFLSLHPPLHTPENQLFWIRVVMFVTSFIGPILVLFIHTFPREKVTLSIHYIIPLVLLMFFSASASLSALVFKTIEYPNGMPVPTPGIGIPIFFLDFIGLFILSFVMLILKYRRSTFRERIQLKYMLAGIALSFSLMGITTVVFVVILRTSSLVFLGPIFPVILMAAIAYAIVKHRFLDIQPIIARAVSYTFLIIIVAAVYSYILFAGTSLLFGELIDRQTLAFIVALTTILSLAFQPLHERVTKITDKLFFKGNYDADELLSKLTRVAVSKIDLAELTDTILEILTREMRVTKAAFLLVNNHSIQDVKGIGYQKEHLLRSTLESFLHENLERDTQSILFDDILGDAERELLRSFDIMVLIPIRVGNAEVALLVLGPKLAGDFYSRKDINLLEIFASESGIAIKNAELYGNLKSALEAKSQFISVVSHQMRTPIAAIRWSLELLDQTKLTPIKRKKFLNTAYHNSLYLVEQLDDVLTALSIQDRVVSVSNEACDVGFICKEVLPLFAHEISEKELNVKTNFAENVRDINCDRQKVKKILRILIKNAVSYTQPQGSIEIASEERLEQGTSCLAISVKDSGIGVTPEEKEKLFEKFYRSDRARKILPNGLGLGMFIAKAFAAAHGGIITVDSSGEDKGSVFSCILPRVIENTKLVMPEEKLSANVQMASESLDSHLKSDHAKFLGTITHQLRAPLTTVKFIAEQMLEGKSGLSKEHVKELELIIQSSKKAINLVGEILNIDKFISKEAKPVFESCRLEDIILKLISFFEPNATAKNQKLEFIRPKDLRMVNVCNDFLERAFQNIIDNAIIYGDKNSTITITLGENESHDSYIVSIHNFGPTIPKEEMPKMFEQFHRVPGSELLKPDGTGLGLFIAKSAIELNGGKIWITSKEKEGTAVLFTVPFGVPRAKN